MNSSRVYEPFYFMDLCFDVSDWRVGLYFCSNDIHIHLLFIQIALHKSYK